MFIDDTLAGCSSFLIKNATLIKIQLIIGNRVTENFMNVVFVIRNDVLAYTIATILDVVRLNSPRPVARMN